MSTISTIGQTLAMDGQAFYSSNTAKAVNKGPEKNTTSVPTAAEVSRNIADSLADKKASVQELQKLSDMVSTNKLQFNVNEELDKVIVTVVDPSTNKVVREIPSEELQKIEVNMKHVMGLLFDELI